MPMCATRALCVVALATAFSHACYAADYYVSPTGNNSNGGSETQPWRTIQYAANVLSPGDTVYIADGTYNERVTVRRSGTASLPITFAGSSNVILDGLNSGGTLFSTAGQQNLRISGLTVQNTGSWGQGILVDNSRNVTVDNCRTLNTYDSGIMVRNSQFVTVAANEIQGACLGGEESLTVKISQDVVVNNNYIHHTGHEGIDVKEGSARVSVHHNYLHNIERQALYTDSWNRATTDIEFHSNVMHDSMFGISIGAETGGLLSNVRVYNNLMYNMVGPALSVQDWGSATSAHPIKDVVLANNTAFNTGYQWGGGLLLENAEADGVIVRNNIFAGIANPIQIASGERPTNLLVDHNLANNSYISEPGWWILGDPRFVDAAAADFRLTAVSPAIDAGWWLNAPVLDLEGNPRPYGGGFDIGAYEYTVIPEPASITLLLGVAMMSLSRRRAGSRVIQTVR